MVLLLLMADSKRAREAKLEKWVFEREVGLL